MKKELKEKAIDIKGKKYVLVSDRIIFFNQEYKNGAIKTELVSYENKQITIKAVVIPDSDKPDRFFTGWSQEIEGSTFINKTSALENAETSAVGRALAMMGIGVIDSISSVDEINKANNRPASTLGKCEKCGADKVKNPKTGKIFCEKKCWLKAAETKNMPDYSKAPF